MEDYDDLSPEQRPAHLVYWYESEVQNGGHLQYFENRGTEHLAAPVKALGSLGAMCQQQVLREAGRAMVESFTSPYPDSAGILRHWT
jgi:HrpA-like RNA helicase